MDTDESEVSKPSSCEGDAEKQNAGPERALPVVVFTSKKLLWAEFLVIWLTKLVMLLIDEVVLSLTPHVMSRFSESANSVLSVLPIVVGISSGVLRLPMAKIIDKIGRDGGFIMAWCISLLGLLIYTGAQSITATVVAQIFYGIGSSCLDFVLTIVLADMSSLKNRALIYGIYTTPVIYTTVAGPAIAEELLSQVDWRGSFGVCAGIWLACVAAPLPVLVIHQATYTLWDDDQESGATITQQSPRMRGSLRRFAVELDIPGVILAIAGICLFLLPFILAPRSEEGWPGSTFYVMVALGALSLGVFAFWEMALAPVTCFPWHLMRDKNLLGGCLVVMFAAASTASWGPYYNSYLQVVHDQTITTAGYITYIRVLAFSLSALNLGLLLRKTGDYKVPALIAGPILGIFTGLLLAFHGTESPVTANTALAALAAFQVFCGFSERFLITCSQMAVMANVDHEHVAMAVGIWGTFLSIAVGFSSVGAAYTWTNGVPRILENALPTDSRNLTKELLGSIEKTQQYPLGSPIRDAVVAAYWEAQEYLVIKGACFVPLAFACIFMWRSIDLRKRNEPQGARAKGVIW